MIELLRIELDGKVETKDGQQFVDGKGFFGDKFEKVHRIEPIGFASHPVKGGIAIAVAARGRDIAYVLGGEKPQDRPETSPGETVIYSAGGATLRLNGKTATFDGDGWTINAGRGVTINGPLTVKGDLRVEGAAHATGNITSDTPDGEDE